MKQLPEPILFFGCGNMGGAILRGWLNAGAVSHKFHVISPSKRTMPNGVNVYSKATEYNGKMTAPDILILGMKPQMLNDCSEDIVSLLGKDTIIISLLAGIGHAQLSALFPDNDIVRMMPNLAVEIGKSPIGLYADGADIRPLMDDIVSPLGKPLWVDKDAHIHIVTALAGSGPAYLFRFIDALAEAGTSLGLDTETSLLLAKMMVDGASDLASASPFTPRELAEKVTSKAGTTAAGLEQLDHEDTLQQLIYKTVKAAHDRSMALSKLS